MKKKADPYENIQKVYKQLDKENEELLKLLEEEEAREYSEDEDEDEPSYVYTPIMPKTEPEPKQKIIWNGFVGLFALITMLISTGKLLFSHTLDLRWWLATGILLAIYIVMRIFKI